MPELDPILKNAGELVRDIRQLIAVNPAARAALRHSLSLGPDDVSLDVHRIVTRHLPQGHLDDATERAFYAVAAFMAAQSRDARDEEPARSSGVNGSARRLNLGDSLAHAVHDKGFNEKSIEPRLQLLARQDLSGLHRQLPRLVLYLRGKGIWIDWAVLASDLARWGHHPKHVAKEWMQSYYRTSERLTAQNRPRGAAAATTERSPEK